jgi:hypothetical protein
LNFTNDTRDNPYGNPYCSKVVYQAWRATGIELNANNAYGNVVAPDELYYSAYNRYVTYTIKQWTEQTYAGTCYLIREMSR